MELETLLFGVLRIMTPLGPRYLKPSILERLYLMWVFRHFHALPVKVLSRRQQRLIESMCENGQFVSFGMGVEDAPLIGTLEQRPPISKGLPPRRPSESVADSVAPFAADIRRR
jgi:hypothetical protein